MGRSRPALDATGTAVHLCLMPIGIVPTYCLVAEQSDDAWLNFVSYDQHALLSLCQIHAVPLYGLEGVTRSKSLDWSNPCPLDVITSHFCVSPTSNMLPLKIVMEGNRGELKLRALTSVGKSSH